MKSFDVNNYVSVWKERHHCALRPAQGCSFQISNSHLHCADQNGSHGASINPNFDDRSTFTMYLSRSIISDPKSQISNLLRIFHVPAVPPVTNIGLPPPFAASQLFLSTLEKKLLGTCTLADHVPNRRQAEPRKATPTSA